MNAEDLVYHFNELAARCYQEARDRGFYDAYDLLVRDARASHGSDVAIFDLMVGQRVALIVTELGEFVEAQRKPSMSDKIPDYTAAEEELADVVIRILDMAGFMGIDLKGAMKAKLEMNRKRPYRHGGKAF